jgi:hypothetical protein
MHELFNQLITEKVNPYLKSEGFKKKGLSFYKRTGDLIYLFNFQNSRGNSAEQATFYINCGIHSTIVDKVLGAKEKPEPKEYECYFRKRISALTNSSNDDFSIDKKTSIEKIATDVLKELATSIQFFNAINSTVELTDLMIERNGLNNYSKLFEYLLKTKDDTRLIILAKKLFSDFGTDDRWAIFEDVLNNLLRQNKNEQTITEIINLK